MNLPDYAPFDTDQRAALDNLLPSLRPDQAAWLSGFIAGVQSAGDTTAAPALATPSRATAKKPELTILFGTESGNCEVLADQTAKLAKSSGFKPKVRNMSDTSAGDLAAMRHLLVIVSTWGDGDPPDAATAFIDDLMGSGAPKLNDVSFSVCALGDTAYEKFCETGKQVDHRLEKLGGNRIHPRQDCDVDFDDPWKDWASAAIAAFPKPAAAGAGAVQVIAPTSSGAAATGEYSKKNPWQAEILEKINLNGTGSNKETWHIELALDGSGLSYTPGDALAVIPENRPEDVEALIAAGNLDGNIADDLRTKFDITTLSARLVGKYNGLAKSEKLTRLLAEENKAELLDWLHGRQPG